MTENTVCVTTKTVQKAIERYVAERCHAARGAGWRTLLR